MASSDFHSCSGRGTSRARGKQNQEWPGMPSTVEKLSPCNGQLGPGHRDAHWAPSALPTPGQASVLAGHRLQGLCVCGHRSSGSRNPGERRAGAVEAGDVSLGLALSTGGSILLRRQSSWLGSNKAPSRCGVAVGLGLGTSSATFDPGQITHPPCSSVLTSAGLELFQLFVTMYLLTKELFQNIHDSLFPPLTTIK